MEFEKLTKVLNEIGLNVVNEYKKSLLKGLPNRDGITFPTSSTSGRLYNSIDYRLDINPENGNSTLYFIAEKYFLNIENGRIAGSYPNITAIENWIKKKRILDTKGLSIKRRAFAIAKSIKDKGIKKKPFLENALNKVLSKAKDMLNEAISEDLKINISINIEEGIKKIDYNKGNKMLKITHKYEINK